MKAQAKEKKEFVEYCWVFYGPQGVYSHFFDKPLTKKEIGAAVVLRMETGDFAADSFDREAVRDLLLLARSQN